MERKTHVIVASIILSILVWLSVSMNNQYSVSIRVPLRILNLPDDLALANPVPRDIVVRIRGTGWELAAAYFSSTTSINVDAANFESRRIVLTSRDLGYSLDLGTSAEVLGFTPDSLMITTDTIITKEVAVIPRVTIQPRDNYAVVGPVRVSPDSVWITGARRLLSRMESWYTERKSFSGTSDDIDITLALSDTLARVVHVGSQSVEFQADIQQLTDNTFKNVPITVINDRDSVKVLLLPPTVDVTVRGGIGLMSDLTADSFKATVDYEFLSRSTSSRFLPTMKLPALLKLISVQPDSIEFVIKK